MKYVLPVSLQSVEGCMFRWNRLFYQVFIRHLLLWRCFSERACRLVFLRQSPWNSICCLSELSMKEYSMKIKLLLRLTSGNQFGMDESVLIQVIHLSRENAWVEVEGIQFFSGTQKTQLRNLSEN